MATKLYVGNLSDSVSDKHLRELFEAFGIVDEVAVLRGFGFVVSRRGRGSVGNLWHTDCFALIFLSTSRTLKMHRLPYTL